MTRYITTGSAIERAMRCPPSLVLPRASYESPWSDRGTIIHRFLEDVVGSGYDAALAAVPSSWRDCCAALELEGLEHILAGGVAEIAMAFCCETGKVRELGRGRGRCYEDVTETEIPTTLDWVGIAVIGGTRRALIIDWKTGWAQRGKTAVANWQVDFGALCVSRLFEVELGEVQIIHVAENARPWVSRAPFTSLDVDATADEVVDLYRRAIVMVTGPDNERFPAPTEYSIGPWCNYCASRTFCPAKTSELRRALAGDELHDLLRVSPMPIDLAAEGWRRLQSLKRSVQAIEGAIKAMARDQPIYLGVTAEGRHEWLAPRLVKGKRTLEGERTFEVLEELHGTEVANNGTRLVARIGEVEKAIRGVAPPRKGAAFVKAAFDKLEAVGAVSQRPRIDIDVVTTADTIAPAVPQLPDVPYPNEEEPDDD